MSIYYIYMGASKGQKMTSDSPELELQWSNHWDIFLVPQILKSWCKNFISDQGIHIIPFKEIKIQKEKYS